MEVAVRILLRCLISLCLCAAAVAHANTDLYLVKDGQMACQIVLSEAPSKSATDAAKELAATLLAMSGLECPIRHESDTAALQNENITILIGDSTRAAQLGVEGKLLPPEGFVIRVRENQLLIV